MADQKLTDLTADTSPTADDLLYLVNDPGGTPGDRKVTKADLQKDLGTPTTLVLTNATGLPAAALVTISSLYVLLQDQQTQNTNGGTFTSGAWRTRVLNTEVSDVGGLCSLVSNQFTLTAGTYLIHATAPAYLTAARHQARLQNITDGTTLVLGTSIYAPTISANTVVTQSVVRGIFTVAASKALELQHISQGTEATDGFGVAANFTTEIYSVVELWKIG